MFTSFLRAVAATSTLAAAVVALGMAPAHAVPTTCPAGANADGDACRATLASVTANTTDGTLTGTPAGGSSSITLTGQAPAYQKSTGFTGTPPDPVQQWDATIDRVTTVDPANPDWYGQGKANTFLPRQLNDLATHFPANTVAVRFVPDDTYPGWFRLLSIQPVG